MRKEKIVRGYTYDFTEGEWVHIQWGHDWLLACCDCGLVHQVDRKLVRDGLGSKLMIRMKRHEPETEAYRKAKKKTKRT